MEFNTLMLYSKEFSLIVFFLVFLGIVFWAYWPGNRDRFKKEGEKILEDDDNSQ